MAMKYVVVRHNNGVWVRASVVANASGLTRAEHSSELRIVAVFNLLALKHAIQFP
jgi:hypothetical protein